MIIEPHPTHARHTRFVIAALFAIAVISWAIGYYAQESLEHQFLVNICVSIFMISGSLILILFIAREHFLRCLTCKRWLRNRGKIGENNTRNFVCSKCNIIWDSAIKVSGAGE